MGTIVVQRYVEARSWPAPRVFANVVLSSADADNQGHAAWVEQIARVENVFVTVNAEDRVLRKSTDSRPAGALALGHDPGSPRAPSATYRRFSTRAHEIFTRVPERRDISDFFTAVFNGGPVPD